MRIGVVADTHISSARGEIPKEILSEFQKVEMIVHAGDLVNLSVLDKLRRVCKNIKAVQGNMDQPEVIKQLPEKEIIKIGNYKIGVMHGSGPPDNLIELMMKVFKDEGVNLVIFGHSHYPLQEKRGSVLYFNPGSPTDKIFAPYNSYGIIEINDKIEARIIRIQKP